MTYGITAVDTRRAWITTATVVFAAAAALVALFWSEARGIYRVWLESTAYNHGFLVLPLVGYMIWDRRDALAETAPRPQFWTLAALPALSAVWFVAASLGVHEAEQMVVLTMLQTILLSVLGWGAYRRLMAPLLYLYFLVPTGEFLVPTLQDWTANLAVRGLHLAGVPVFSDGIFIEIPAGKFVVAEQCAGLRFLIAAVAYGVFFAVITYRSWTRRTIFIALSVVVPILANALRVFGILYAAELVGSASAVVADHVVYGWGFFSAILLLLTLVGRSFADRAGETRADHGPRMRRFSPARSVLVALLGLALSAVGPLYGAALDRQVSDDLLARAEPPGVAPPWRRVADTTTDDWTPSVFGADRAFLDAWTDGDDTVFRFVSLYVAHGRVNNLIRGDNRLTDEWRWRTATSRGATLDVSGHPLSVNLSEIASGGRRRLVVSFYVVDGAIVSGRLSAKVRQLRGLLTPGTAVSAFVAVAVDMPDRGKPPLMAAARFLAAMENMPAELNALAPR